MRRYNLYWFLFLMIMTIVFSCQKKEDETGLQNGNIVFQFEHYVNDQPAVYDQMKYINTAGNQYELSEIQWFVSDITIHKKDGTSMLLDEKHFAHYIDTDLPDTHTWVMPDDIPAGDYSSVSMTFGIKGEKNQPYMFTDPPESDMLWPINLGGEQGGYHYMKLNGFWINKNGQREPFNFHLGVGQQRDAEGNITGFIQNWFEVDLPASSFTIAANETKSVTIRMNIEKWWDRPNIYNHDDYGGKIMQNQEAMGKAAENGRNVFSISDITKVVVE